VIAFSADGGDREFDMTVHVGRAPRFSVDFYLSAVEVRAFAAALIQQAGVCDADAEKKASRLMGLLPDTIACPVRGASCWFVKTWTVGDARAVEMRDKHMREAHPAEASATFPPESKLFVLPPVAVQKCDVAGCRIALPHDHGYAPDAIPPGAVQSDTRVLDGTDAQPVQALRICRTCHKLPCTCPQDVIRELPIGEPDDPEARAYLDSLRMVAQWLRSTTFSGPEALASVTVFGDIARVVAVHGRTLELGGALEGHS
jgi:hypothetical protein